jgi:hypothetical protein
MRDHAEQRQPIQPLVAEGKRGMAFVLLEDEHEQAAAVDVTCARDRRVHDRLLDDPVEAKRRLGLDARRRRHGGKRLRQHLVHLFLQDVELHAAGREHAPRLWLVDNRQQQMLEADGVVTPVGGEPEGALNGLERLRRERNRALTHGVAAQS